MLDKLAARGRLLVVVNQPATIGALPADRAALHRTHALGEIDWFE